MDRVFGQKKVMAYLPRLSWQQVVVCSLSMTMTAGTLQASDLDIYKGGTSGGTTIFMMLDTSGSMGWGYGYGGSSMSLASDYNVCLVNSNGGGGSSAVLYENSATSPVYKRYYCSVSQSTYNNLNATYKARVSADCAPNGTGYKCYDRLTRLKDAMFTLLDDNTLSGIKLGAGYYSYNGKGQNGIVSIPAKAMSDTTHVANLKKFVAGLAANGGTPTAAAYAEAGAYMMGTTTSGVTNEDLPVYKEKYWESLFGWRQCNKWRAAQADSENGYAYQKCDTNDDSLSLWSGVWPAAAPAPVESTLLPSGYVITRYTGIFDNPVYAEKTTDTYAITRGTDSVYSGFSNVGKYRDKSYDATSIVTYSPLSDIKGTTYTSPITDTSSCSGSGIYFLTDGFPNGTEPNYVKDLMTLTLKKNVSDASPTIGLTGTKCASGLSSTGAETPATAAWECIGEYSKALTNTANPKTATIKTAVVGFGSSFAGIGQNPDGSYNCNSTTKVDIKNACLWGSKDYGQGGFYLASSSKKIVDSMTQFVNSLKVDFKPSSFGNITIPRDPLDQTQVVADGYYPMIEPSTDTSRLIWRGNLKKYYVTDGTLKDANGNPLYQVDLASSALTLNPLARDQWALIQTSATPDYSPIDVGGAWNQIPVPSALVKNGDPSNNTAARGVYVTIGGVLKAVTKDNVTTVGSGDLSTLTMEQRIGLLGYLGYQVTDTQKNALLALTTDAARQTELKKIVATVPSSPYRFLGGVVHSTPLLLNQSATVDDSGTVTAQKQYVVYGSMEGGLHVVDAATGQEQSVFLVDEVLADTSKLKVLNNPLATGSGLNYGVDAPWATDNSFKVDVSDTGTVSYIAKDMNVYGGLRMGGMSLYGLNLSTVTAPTLKFRITPDSTGFDRMTQIWSKPVVAYVRVKGKRAKVLIFGGGYDPSKYEVNGSATAAFPPTGDIKGNALYIVNAEDGSLLWSASSSNTETASGSQKLKQADVKYSVVGTPNVRDYNNDGLADAIYFADLGGQVFRVDLNNAANKSTDTVPSVVRVQTLAKLNPKLRFYERPAAAVFDDGSRRFVLVSVVSGNRSYPLQNDASVNRIYGLLDYDAAADDLEKDSFKPASTITEADLVSGSLGTSSAASAYTPISDADVTKQKPTSATVQPAKRGWYYDVYAGKSAGVAKVLDEPAIVSSHLYANVYDPTVTPTGTANACTGGVQGMSQSHRICLPYGNCVAYANQKVQGINTTALGPVNTNAGSKSNSIRVVQPNPIKDETCVGTGCDTTATAKPYQYTNRRNIRIARWFEW